jgi:membrane protease YdiL (CAAX protease family)
MGRLVILGTERALRPDRWLWLRGPLWLVALFALVLIAVALAAYAVLYAGAFLTGTDPNHPSEVPGIVRCAGLVLASVAALAAYGRSVRLGENRRPSELGLGRFLPELGLGAAIGTALMALCVAILWVAGWIRISPHAATAIAVPIGYAVASGVIEEVLFRLVIFRLLWRLVGVWPALAASMVVFGMIHLTNPEGTLLGALGTAVEGGVLSAGLYMLTGRIWASIGEHAAWNFTQGWVFGATVSGLGGFKGGPLSSSPMPRIPDILTGGSFGPEGSLVAIVASGAIGAAALWLAWRKCRSGSLLDPSADAA